jgi:preprotein translocase subunit Sss1
MSQDLLLARTRAHAFLEATCCDALYAAAAKRIAANDLNASVRSAAYLTAQRRFEGKTDTVARDNANLAAIRQYEEATAPAWVAYHAAVNIGRATCETAQAAAKEALSSRRQTSETLCERARFLTQEEYEFALELAKSPREMRQAASVHGKQQKLIQETFDADSMSADLECLAACGEAVEVFERLKKSIQNLFDEAVKEHVKVLELACKPTQDAYLEASKDAQAELEANIKEADRAYGDEAFRIQAQYVSERSSRIKLLQTERQKLDAYFKWLSDQPGQEPMTAR